jgi:carnitine monooxygenase subunit
MLDQLDCQTIETDRKRTLEAIYYISKDELNQEKEKVFFRSWLYACHASELSDPGSFVTIKIFDQNLFLVKDREDKIRAFYNVCPHRGHQLVEGSGKKSRITCPYHAWTFALDGKRIGARSSETLAGPSNDEICLSEIRVDHLVDFIFINLDPQAQPLSVFAPGLEEQILSIEPDLPSMRPEETVQLDIDYPCEANWKVLVDNYLECHHCLNAHDQFNDMMDLGKSSFALNQNYTFQIAPTEDKAENKAFPLDRNHDITTGHFWWLFPNTLIGQFPGAKGFYLSTVTPVTPDSTMRKSVTLKPPAPTDPEMEQRHNQRAEWFPTVSAEDKALCENVQRGMHQRGYQQGWYVTDPEAHDISEHAMRYFHDLYLAAMTTQVACSSAFQSK